MILKRVLLITSLSFSTVGFAYPPTSALNSGGFLGHLLTGVTGQSSALTPRPHVRNSNDYGTFSTNTPVMGRKKSPQKRSKKPQRVAVQRVAQDREKVALSDCSDCLELRMKEVAGRHGVVGGFSSSIENELLKIEQKGLDLDSLEDLTDVEFITIDNDHSKDLDQAMSIARTRRGFRVFYAIADASYFIEPGSDLESRAFERYFTTYLPLGDIPILPRKLSEDLCSLNPGVERRAIVSIVDLDDSGEILEYEFKHARVKSVLQTSYRLVDQFQSSPESFGPEHIFHANSSVKETVECLKQLGSLLVKRAVKRGVVPIVGNRELRLSEDERAVVYVDSPKLYQVEAYNAEISILTNHVVAEYIRSKGYRSIHRHHPEALPHRLRFLRESLGKIGIKWYKNQPLSECISKLDESLSNTHVASQLASRVNELAVYSESKQGHFGLKIDKDYTHFTAPMRRAADLFVHRILLAILEGSEVPYQGADEQLSVHALEVNEAQKKVKAIERECRDMLISLALKPYKGKTVEGVVTYISNYGVQVRLEKFPFDVTVDFEQLSKKGIDHQQYKGHHKVCVGEYHWNLGDMVNLEVDWNVEVQKVMLFPAVVG